jgi:hypothetical protein
MPIGDVPTVNMESTARKEKKDNVALFIHHQSLTITLFSVAESSKKKQNIILIIFCLTTRKLKISFFIIKIEELNVYMFYI